MFTDIQVGEIRFPNMKQHKISISKEAKDLIRRLLIKDRNKRFGAQGGINEVLAHPWFANIDKVKLLRKKLAAPYKPNI